MPIYQLSIIFSDILLTPSYYRVLLFGPGFVAPGKNKSCSSFRLIPLLKTHGGGLDCLGGTILRRFVLKEIQIKIVLE